ncbi:MAG: DUF4115 domain-containing protein [Bryobacterales bacterium]|nr:DUF4115 domain-containing protein [Bryobacterales bacterium]
MASLGEKLKEARLKQGLSLNEIAERTRIQAHFLEAMEQDKLEVIPGAFFRKSFVRQYASTLGLNPDEFETDTSIQFGSFGDAGGGAATQPLSFREQPDLPPMPTPGSEGHFPFRQALLSIGLLVGVVAVCAVAYMFWEDYQNRDRSAPGVAAPETAGSRESPALEATAPGTPEAVEGSNSPEETMASGTGPVDALGSAAATGTPPTSSASSPAPDAANPSAATAAEASPQSTVHGSGDREIRLSANSLTWVRVREGDRVLYVGTIDAGQSRLIRVGENAQILTGNAGGLNVVWQGNDVGKIGPSGQVRTVTLTPQGASIQAPAPKPAPESSDSTSSPGQER